MSVLFEAAQMVSSSLNIKQVLENIVCLAQKVVGFDAGGILLFDRGTKEVVYDATYNYSPDEVAALKRCRPFGEILKTLDKDYMIQPVEDHFTCSLISKIEMAVPMIINSEIYGIWFAENHLGDHFSSDRKKMLTTLANLTSSAIKNAWLYERTRFDATTDQLTGLYNRKYFDHVLEMEKEKTRLIHNPLSLIMVDVNRLKYINDTFGHEMGDLVIRETAVVLKKSVRKGELIFRYGGDEMVILLPNSDYRQTAKVVGRIKANTEDWNLANCNKQIFLHLSIGWFTAREAESLEKLVTTADERMYRDKTEYYKSHGLVRETVRPM
ncbi:MAG: sensor domain-containing diguanylate cyclase [Eubacteriales bacterium]